MKVFLSRIHSSFWNDPNFFLLYRRNWLWWLRTFAYSFHKKYKGVFIFIFIFIFNTKLEWILLGKDVHWKIIIILFFFLMDFCFVLYFWTFCWLGRWPLDFGQLKKRVGQSPYSLRRMPWITRLTNILKALLIKKKLWKIYIYLRKS